MTTAERLNLWEALLAWRQVMVARHGRRILPNLVRRHDHVVYEPC